MRFFVLVALLCAVSFAAVVKLDNSNFDAIVMDSNKNVFVKFFAPWCGHCTRMAPAWEELAKAETKDDVIIAELDADANREAAQKHGIRGFPTIKLFTKNDKSGKPYQGARDQSSLANFLKANI